MIPTENRGLLVAALANEVAPHVDENYLPSSELAEAMMNFLEAEGLQDPFPTNLIALMGARCLTGLGNPSGGLAFLDHYASGEYDRATYEDLIHIHPFTVRLWRLVEAGVVARKLDLTSTEIHYQLNIGRLPMDESQLDLTIFVSLKNLVETFSPLWSAWSGKVHLSIRGLPKKRARNAALPTARNILEYCQDLIEQMAHDQHWTHRPVLTVRELGIL